MAFEIDQQARIFTDALNLAAVRDTRIARAARSTSVFSFSTLLAGLLIMVRAVVFGWLERRGTSRERGSTERGDAGAT